MNAKRMLWVAAVIGTLSVQAGEERVNLDQLPEPVRKTIAASQQDGTVKKIQRRVVEGRTVYEVEIDRNNAPNPRLRIAEDGTLVREPVLPYVSSSDMPVVVPEYTDAAPALPRLRLEDLPGAVQQTARTEAKGRQIADLDRETWQGRPVYEVEFKDSGPNSRVYIAEDGTVVRNEQQRGLKSMLMGTQLEDTPAAVQETIRRLAGGREVADIDRRDTSSGPVYRVELRGPQGTQELRIAEDGKVVYDSRAAKPSRG